VRLISQTRFLSLLLLPPPPARPLFSPRRSERSRTIDVSRVSDADGGAVTVKFARCTPSRVPMRFHLAWPRAARRAISQIARVCRETVCLRRRRAVKIVASCDGRAGLTRFFVSSVSRQVARVLLVVADRRRSRNLLIERVARFVSAALYLVDVSRVRFGIPEPCRSQFPTSESAR